jgi:hypothetical protein
MSKKHLAGILAATTALALMCVIRVIAAEGTAAAALTGVVSSQADGPMEGVLVGAKRAGSTISTWVVSNAQGQYSFPPDRMPAGHYAISIRAVGYELPATSVDLKGDAARLDLQLTKITRPMKTAAQMSNAELIMSAPGPAGQRNALGGCVNCHTLQRVFFSRFEHAAPYEQFIADASVVSAAGGTAARADDRAKQLRQVSQLDQPECVRHVPVPAEGPAPAERESDAGDLHGVRPAAPRRLAA